MSQPRDDRQDDLFRSSLEQIINLRHPLVRLAAEINWDFLAKRFSSVCRVGPGQPPVPVVNQIRTYWWCSPPRTGRQSMLPARSTARETGASFSKERCVRTSL